MSEGAGITRGPIRMHTQDTSHQSKGLKLRLEAKFHPRAQKRQKETQPTQGLPAWTSGSFLSSAYKRIPPHLRMIH